MTSELFQPAKPRRGAFVVLVGPDGAGKTSVASALVDLHHGPTGYVHFRPSLWRPLPPAPRGEASSRDKESRPGNQVIGWLRLAWSVVLFWLGYTFRIRPALRAGSLVVGDRWGYGYFAQPSALRFYGPKSLASVAVRLLPRPDLVINLVADPRLIRSRKKELSLAEIEHELRLWSDLPVRDLHRLDASLDVASVAAEVYKMAVS